MKEAVVFGGFSIFGNSCIPLPCQNDPRFLVVSLPAGGAEQARHGLNFR